MTLGEVFAEAASRDLTPEERALLKEGRMRYTELLTEGRIQVKLCSTTDEHAYIEASIPFDGLEATKNYCRMELLAMVFKAAIAGMKRKKEKPNAAPARWVAKIFEYCQAINLSPEELVKFHKKWRSYPHEQ